MPLRISHIEAKCLREYGGHANIQHRNMITDMHEDDGYLKINFVFELSYEPSVALFTIGGEMNMPVEQELLKKSVEAFKNKQNIPAEIADHIHSVVITYGTVMTTILAKEVMLPPPIPILTPRTVQQQQQQQQQPKDEGGMFR